MSSRVYYWEFHWTRQMPKWYLKICKNYYNLSKSSVACQALSSLCQIRGLLDGGRLTGQSISSQLNLQEKEVYTGSIFSTAKLPPLYFKYYTSLENKLSSAKTWAVNNIVYTHIKIHRCPEIPNTILLRKCGFILGVGTWPETQDYRYGDNSWYHYFVAFLGVCELFYYTYPNIVYRSNTCWWQLVFWALR